MKIYLVLIAAGFMTHIICMAAFNTLTATCTQKLVLRIENTMNGQKLIFSRLH